MSIAETEIHTPVEGILSHPIAKNKKSLSKHAASGAMVASILASLAVIHYMVNTVIGSYGFGESILSYVIGDSFNMNEIASEALFIVVTRFLVVFCFSWLPITAIITATDKS